jgi:hypothetical protein
LPSSSGCRVAVNDGKRRERADKTRDKTVLRQVARNGPPELRSRSRATRSPFPCDKIPVPARDKLTLIPPIIDDRGDLRVQSQVARLSAPTNHRSLTPQKKTAPPCHHPVRLGIMFLLPARSYRLSLKVPGFSFVESHSVSPLTCIAEMSWRREHAFVWFCVPSTGPRPWRLHELDREIGKLQVGSNTYSISTFLSCIANEELHTLNTTHITNI